MIKSALSGEDVVIANRGLPVVRLVPVEPAELTERPAQSGTNLATWLRENPLSEHLKRRHEDIEKSIRAQRDSCE